MAIIEQHSQQYLKNIRFKDSKNIRKPIDTEENVVRNCTAIYMYLCGCKKMYANTHACRLVGMGALTDMAHRVNFSVIGQLHLNSTHP